MDNNKKKEKKICYIGGGSRGWAWRLMSDLVSQDELSGQVVLYDINRETVDYNQLIGNKMSALVGAKSSWIYCVATSLEEALVGADFVIISILPGSFNLMQSDVHSPEAYGIYQSVGDTAGPGGFMRALRTIPLYIDFAKAIKRYSPDAWVINYTNPMSICIQTLYYTFPSIKAFGCCHEVFATQQLLISMLLDQQLVKQGEIKRRDIKINVLGINHCTWIDEAFWGDINLIPLYRQFVDKYAISGFGSVNLDDEKERYFESMNRVKFDLFNRYGSIAAAGDRHLAEFIPHHYLANPNVARAWKFDLTPVSYRIKEGERLDSIMKGLARGEVEPKIEPSDEEGVDIIKALCGIRTLVSNANLPNRGQISNLTLGATVETNVLFSSNSAKPVISGSIDRAIGALIGPQIANHRLIIEGLVAKDKKSILNAFIQDGSIHLTQEKAQELFDLMIFNTKEMLPHWLVER